MIAHEFKLKIIDKFVSDARAFAEDMCDEHLMAYSKMSTDVCWHMLSGYVMVLSGLAEKKRRRKVAAE
jgi:hypothetical protein